MGLLLRVGKQYLTCGQSGKQQGCGLITYGVS